MIKEILVSIRMIPLLVSIESHLSVCARRELVRLPLDLPTYIGVAGYAPR
jgi:hypothetical protein